VVHGTLGFHSTVVAKHALVPHIWRLCTSQDGDNLVVYSVIALTNLLQKFCFTGTPAVHIPSEINAIHHVQPFHLRSILTLSFHLLRGLPSFLFPSGFPANSHACYMSCQSHGPLYSGWFLPAFRSSSFWTVESPDAAFPSRLVRRATCARA
jgi:hypothetical protein